MFYHIIVSVPRRESLKSLYGSPRRPKNGIKKLIADSTFILGYSAGRGNNLKVNNTEHLCLLDRASS